MNDRPAKMKKELMRLSSLFFAQESNRTSLITVTSINIAPDFKRATIGISVLPESHEEQAVLFAQRRTRDMRNYIGNHLQTKMIPRLEIVIDQGEKNRRRIQDISQGITFDDIQK
jgi:ribosome-binding factor A